jgi:hypothetical protein
MTHPPHTASHHAVAAVERYKMLMDLMKYHQTIIWGSFTAFALTHSIFLGVFARFVMDGTLSASDKPHWGVVGAALMGLIFWLPWYVTYQRSNYYFIFRLEQAKRAEPEGLNVLKGSMERLTEYGEVFIDETRYKLPLMVGLLKTRHAIPMFINGFFAIYAFFLLSQIPFVKAWLRQTF